ncbi:MAG: ATP-binding protein [Zavarzinella sp.]
MSMKSFKNLLGETNLERKCRILLGLGTLLLMSVSFWIFARETENLAFKQTTTSGQLLIPTILARQHFQQEQLQLVDEFENQAESNFPDAFGDYTYKLIKPNAKQPQFKPEATEIAIVNRIMGNPTSKDETQNDLENGKFHYYSVVRAEASCVQCHNVTQATLDNNGVIKEGDMMGIVKVTLSTKSIETGKNVNRALLLSFAIMTSLLIVAGSYLIIRYVIVRPVKHLKEVANAIVTGQLNVRSEIHTGDEFEDLSEAFNRMLKHLMQAQEEQAAIYNSLDMKANELARANLALYESNKTQQHFVSTVSHELRTPLNGIIGFSDVLLSSGGSLNEKQARWVMNIRKSGQHLLSLINDILDLAKIEAGKMEVRIEDFTIPSVFELIQFQFRLPLEEKQIHFQVELDQRLPTVRQDPVKIRQILTNLISNAIKFTPTGGRVTVKSLLDGENVLFIVQDTGPGIAEADQKLIFEKFRQSSSIWTREHEGTGLGLSIVRELCELLGGEISLESTPGSGATFMVHIPINYVAQNRTSESSEMKIPHELADNA